MNLKLRKIGSLAFAMALLISAMGAPAAAAIAWDTETTTTTTTSEVDGATTSISVYPGNSSKTLYVETDGATTGNLSLQLVPAESAGTISYVAYANKTVKTVNSANGHYSWTIPHSELDVPRSHDGADYEVRVVDRGSGNTVLNTTVTISTSAAPDDTAVMAVSSAFSNGGAATTPAMADALEISTKKGLASMINPFSDANGTTVATWSGYTTINGSSSDVVVRMANSSTSSAYDAAASSVEDGKMLPSATHYVNNQPYAVYKNKLPSSHNGTGVYYDVATNTLHVQTGSEYQDIRTVQMRGAAGKSYGFLTIAENFGLSNAFSVEATQLNPF